MGFYELAKSRYSTRSFSDRKVSDEDINKILDIFDNVNRFFLFF